MRGIRRDIEKMNHGPEPVTNEAPANVMLSQQRDKLAARQQAGQRGEAKRRGGIAEMAEKNR